MWRQWTTMKLVRISDSRGNMYAFWPDQVRGAYFSKAWSSDRGDVIHIELAEKRITLDGDKDFFYQTVEKIEQATNQFLEEQLDTAGQQVYTFEAEIDQLRNALAYAEQQKDKALKDLESCKSDLNRRYSNE